MLSVKAGELVPFRITETIFDVTIIPQTCIPDIPASLYMCGVIGDVYICFQGLYGLSPLKPHPYNLYHPY